MKTFLERLLCRHEWVKTAVRQEVDEIRNIRYGVRRYECRKCGKASYQDGRADRLEKKAVYGFRREETIGT